MYYSLFATSFVSDSVLGMGESDFEGSIHQPLVEKEVIPIGNSSTKELPHEASDDGSSSFERLMDSSNIGEGSSQLCEEVEPSVAPL